jgi:serine/threonine protein kinase/Tfp pilus assembly protein PilF
MKCSKCQHQNPEGTLYCAKCGAELQSSEEAPPSVTKTLQIPVKEFSPGSTFAGRYEIIELLGKGGMGKVYKVLDKQINEEMALKVLKPDIVEEEGTIERFRNELKIARKIAHRNICRMFDIDEDAGVPYITMEYVPGEDLKDIIRKKEALPEKEILTIAGQVCEGLVEAHDLGVVHRDLKPQNIMIDGQNRVKIMDFGIARSVEAPGMTQAGVIIGTPDYLSPEQAEGMEADERSDIYSFGVILYEMATGQVPFTGDTAISVVLKHKTQNPLHPRKLNPAISEDLSNVILRCMQKNRQSRYQNVRELLQAITSLEKGISLDKPFLLKEGPFFALLKSRKFLIPISAVVFAFITIIFWHVFSGRQISSSLPDKPSIAVISFENQTGDKSYDILQELIPNYLITKLEAAGNMQVTTWERLLDLMKQKGNRDVEFIDRELGFELCRMDDIDAIVFGSVSKLGNMFTTDVKVWDVNTRQLVSSASAMGDGPESILITQIQELSLGILKGMGVPENQIGATSQKIAEVGTDSLEAYQYYLIGKDYFDKLYWSEAREFLEKAVETDPTFAYAYLLLGTSYRSLGEYKAELAAYKKAKEFSHKATERERFWIEGAHLIYVEGAGNDLYIPLLKQFIEKFPKEKTAHWILGYNYSSEGMLDKALESYHKSLELDPEFGMTLNSIGLLYSRMGDYRKATDFLEKYAELYPEDANALDSLAWIYFQWGKVDEAIYTYHDALDLKHDFPDSLMGLSIVHSFKENYREALHWAEQLISRSDNIRSRTNGNIRKGYLHYWIGEYDQALSDLQRAAELANESDNWRSKIIVESWRGFVCYGKEDYEKSREHFRRWIDWTTEKEVGEITSNRAFYDWILGLMDLKEGRFEFAQGRLEELDPSNSEGGADVRSVMSFYHNLLFAEIRMAENMPGQAIEALKYISSQEIIGQLPLDAPRAHGFLHEDTLARAYQQNGKIDEAIEVYEKLLRFDKDSIDRRDKHPMIYYSLAKLNEKKGEEIGAKQNYEKFLALWENADPSISEFQDAKQRLSNFNLDKTSTIMP